MRLDLVDIQSNSGHQDLVTNLELDLMTNAYRQLRSRKTAAALTQHCVLSPISSPKKSMDQAQVTIDSTTQCRQESVINIVVKFQLGEQEGSLIMSAI